MNGKTETYTPVELKESVNTNSEQKLSKVTPQKGTNTYSLQDLAYTRSGDKGNTCNIGMNFKFIIYEFTNFFKSILIN